MTEKIERKLKNKLTLWILRIIIDLNTHKEFIDNDNDFYRDDIAYFLGLGRFVDNDNDTYMRSEVTAILKQKYNTLEKKKPFVSYMLMRNINKLAQLLYLSNTERQILEFVILMDQYEILDTATDMLGNSLNNLQIFRALSKILKIPLDDIRKALKPHSGLIRSSIITIDKNHTSCLKCKIDLLNDSFADKMLTLDTDISETIKDSVRSCKKGSLGLDDYAHLKKELSVLLPYLDQAVKKKKKGVNILFYGMPGTGKTELAKTLSQHLKIKLFEVSHANENNEAIEGYRRLNAYKTAQFFFSSQNILLVYDEAEDIFESSSSQFAPRKQNNKAWINHMLETNPIPTIWITNDIQSIDPALVRRFDINMEVPIPSQSQRARIIRSHSKNLLNETQIQMLARNRNIAPALITRATKVASTIDAKESSQVFMQVLNNTLKAQGYTRIDTRTNQSFSDLYDPSLINTSANLEKLTEGICHNPHARLCLYGPPGTGKSAFGRYIAESLERELLVKKGSDLISKWVGDTEKNIAKAFEEARQERAVLVFDEVDSFLTDRTASRQRWEVTQVNELLVQMENFDGIFIATTNLIDTLDSASLRRFDLKLEFGYLMPAQAWKLFRIYAQSLSLPKPSKSLKPMLERLRYLTPGDFTAVARQHRFRPIQTDQEFISRLSDELLVKEKNIDNIMGFSV